jgi:A/G-specific adenine glycosylase
LPELAGEADPAGWCRQHLNAAVTGERALPPISHAFTHFDLKIEPKWLKLERGPNAVMDRPEWLWYKPAMNTNIGLAAPIAALLESMFLGTEASA